MKRPILFVLACFGLATLPAQDSLLYRTIEGYHNNLQNPDWGAAHTALLPLAGLGFGDGFSTPGGADRPNARTVSNIIFNQPELLPDPMTLSDYTWVFGQFMDHDVGLTEGFGEPMPISIPQGDPEFDPLGFGNVQINMNRTIPMPGTGTDVDNPRLFANELSAFIDGSAVYGSDQPRADWLRSFVDGKLKVSAGNLMPYNTLTGEFDGELDPNAPHMADAAGFNTRLFVAGDVRANENPLLLSLHTLFVREHNRRCDLIKAEHPDWNDEQIYQLARKYVGGHIQAITYNEWLPAMGVPIADYAGYDETVHPQLSNTFTAAAFRVGHTLLNSVILRVDPAGNELPQGHLPLRFGFFNIGAIDEVGGLDPYLAGMAQQVQQTMDNRVVSDIRNFLFGPPGAGGMDLAAININRGRDRGLPTYNAIRQAYGLNAYGFLEQINPDVDVFSQLFQAYSGDINMIDPWVGMLAEKPMSGALFGETILTIMSTQFTALRDGDRFFYLNDPVLTDAQKQEIDATTFRDIIMHNTDIQLMQDNVFLATDYDDVCGSATTSVSGSVLVQTSNNAMPNVELDYLPESGSPNSLFTSGSGEFQFEGVPVCTAASLRPRRDGDGWLNGVSVQDIVIISRHILDIQDITSPYALLAADANLDGNVNVLDIIAIRRLILGLASDLPGDLPMWNFIPTDYPFADPLEPWASPYPDSLALPNPTMMLTERDFTAFKRGDVNGNALVGDANVQPDAGLARSSETNQLIRLEDRYLERGESAEIVLTLTGAPAHYQFALNLRDAELLESIHLGGDAGFLAITDRGDLRFCGEKRATEQNFYLRLKADRPGQLSEFLRLDTDQLFPLAIAEANADQTGTIAFDWRSSKVGGEVAVTAYPDPFLDELTLDVPATDFDGTATLQLIDAAGRTVFTAQQDVSAGNPTRWTVNPGSLPAGLYVYLLRVGESTFMAKVQAAGS